MRDQLLVPELFGAGARYGRERAPDPVTLDWLVSQCERLERILRIQYPERALPKDCERDLAMIGPPNDTTSALQRWALLKHLYRVRAQRLSAEPERDADAAEAARALMLREPVTVELAGERVRITGRSYSAMMEIAAHDLAGRELAEQVARCTRLAARVADELALLPRLGARGRRRALERRLARLRSLFNRMATEREAHRAAIYAHATTPHGGPAADPLQEAPAWWRRADAVDDATLLGALFLAGPARIAALPKPKAKDGEEPKESSFGWASLFAWFERRHHLAPAAAWDTDIGQVIAEGRIAGESLDIDEEA